MHLLPPKKTSPTFQRYADIGRDLIKKMYNSKQDYFSNSELVFPNPEFDKIRPENNRLADLPDNVFCFSYSANIYTSHNNDYDHVTVRVVLVDDDIVDAGYKINVNKHTSFLLEDEAIKQKITKTHTLVNRFFPDTFRLNYPLDTSFDLCLDMEFNIISINYIFNLYRAGSVTNGLKILLSKPIEKEIIDGLHPTKNEEDYYNFEFLYNYSNLRKVINSGSKEEDFFKYANDPEAYHCLMEMIEI